MTKNTHHFKETKDRKQQNLITDIAAQKMPKATVEQINLSKLLRKSSDNEAHQYRLQQIQECTMCGLEEAISALHDADNNVQLAIELILDQKSSNDDWQDTVVKKPKSRRQNENKAQGNSEPQIDKSALPQNDENVSSLSGFIEQKPGKKSNKTNTSVNSVNECSNGHISDVDQSEKQSLLNNATEPEDWYAENVHWKGETIEVVNSTSHVSVNIHDDTELLKLVTSDSNEQEKKSRPEEINSESINSHKPEPKEEIIKTAVVRQSRPDEPARDAKSMLFAKYARSVAPPSSCVPNEKVFLAPEASALNMNTRRSVRSSNIPVQMQQPVFPSPLSAQSLEPAELARPSDRKLNVTNQFPESSDRHKSPNQSNFSPVLNSLRQPVSSLPQDLLSDKTYSTSLQSASGIKETYVKLQEQEPAQNCPPGQPANAYEKPNSYNYMLMDELSQNMNQVSLENRVRKTDAFTQSLSSSQPETGVSPPYHPILPPKPVSQTPNMNKSVPSGPVGPNPQSLPTTQPQMHPALHPGIPHILSHFQTSFPMFNLPNGSGGPALLDMDQLALQQRMLYDMQQSQQQVTNICTESSLPSTCADAMSSSKPGLPLHHVPTGPGFTFVPYSGMVFMNGYPNAFLNQQPASGSPNDSSGHGGSPLTQNSNPQQYAKAINATSNYAGYPAVRQSNFDDMGDSFYSHLSKQIGYKHGGGAQGMYNVSAQQASKSGSADMSLTSKLQQQASGLSSAQQALTSQHAQQPVSNNAAQAPYQQQQQSTNQFTLYQQQYLAMAAAAAAAAAQQQGQQQAQNVVPSSLGGPGGIMPMHNRPQH